MNARARRRRRERRKTVRQLVPQLSFAALLLGSGVVMAFWANAPVVFPVILCGMGAAFAGMAVVMGIQDYHERTWYLRV